MSKVGGIGEIEELILRNLYRIEREERDDWYRVGERYRRFTIGEWGVVALLEIRNQIYGIELIDASKRASFSRAVRTLEGKGLIKTWKTISGEGYRTHANLTKDGKKLALTIGGVGNVNV